MTFINRNSFWGQTRASASDRTWTLAYKSDRNGNFLAIDSDGRKGIHGPPLYMKTMQGTSKAVDDYEKAGNAASTNIFS